MKAAKRACLEPAPGWQSLGVILELLNSGSDPARRVRETGLFVHSDSQKFVTVAVLSRNRRGVLTLVPEKFPAVVLLSGGYSWVPLQTVSPAGFRSARATWSRAAAAGRAVFASVCDISSFPMAATSNCRLMWQTGRARVVGAFPGEARRENNFRRRNRGEARALKHSAGWSAPQPPTPHPSGDRPWPLLAPGSSFLGRCGKRQWVWNLDAPLAIECIGALPNAGWRRRRVGGPLPSGRNPARFLFGFSGAPAAQNRRMISAD